jgi:1-acyl-sn-glycerol-3-phosphate acyltransferase
MDVTRILVFLKMTAVVVMTLVAVSLPLLTRLLTLGSARAVARVGSYASWRWSRWLCSILGIRVLASGKPAGRPYVVASNHVSYLDILVLGSLYPSQFVAKNEIRGWPLLGWISRAAGTLFVDRDSPRDAVRAIRAIRSLLAAGTPITLFPEGGTSRGEEVRPFLPSLLEPAASAGVPCFAASLTYETPNCERPPAETICWSDGSNFVKHFTGVMGLGRIEARVSFSRTPVQSSDRKELAQRLWEDARGSFVPIRQAPQPRRCAP